MGARHDRLTIFFDGGCRPNPGAMETAVVARGAAHVRRDLGDGDSGIAEWLALRHAVDLATVIGASDVLLIGDAATVIDQALGRRPSRDDRLRAYRLAFAQAAAAIPRLHLKWVKRSKNPAGVALDRLSDRPGSVGTATMAAIVRAPDQVAGAAVTAGTRSPGSIR